MTLDLTKPLRIRYPDGRFIEDVVLVGEASESARPLVVWAPRRGDRLEMLYQFKRDGTSDFHEWRLENIPEPKVTEAPIWRDANNGAVFVSTLNRTVDWPVGVHRIGTLRITEVEGQPIKVEVV